jgi:hypothetical protein
MMSFKSILQTKSGTCLSLARGVSSLAGDWTASSRVISLVLKRKQNMSGKTRIRLIRRLAYYSKSFNFLQRFLAKHGTWSHTIQRVSIFYKDFWQRMVPVHRSFL